MRYIASLAKRFYRRTEWETTMYTPPEVPLSIGGVLDDGFSLLKASFAKVFPLALAGSLVSGAANLFFPLTDPAGMRALSAGPTLLVLAATLSSLVFFAAILAMIDATARQREMSFGDALAVGVSRFLPILACVTLFILAVAGGFLLLVIPGIIVSLSLGLAPYLVIVDRMGPIAALKKSHQLIWGNWWRTATIFSVVIFITLSAYFLIGMLAGIGFFVAPGEGGLFSDLVVVVLNALISPVFYVFGMSVLRDLQLRRQGGDLDTRMSAITGD